MYCQRKVGLRPAENAAGETFDRYCGGELTFTIIAAPPALQRSPLAIEHVSACRTCGEVRWQRDSEWVVVRETAKPEVYQP